MTILSQTNSEGHKLTFLLESRPRNHHKTAVRRFFSVRCRRRNYKLIVFYARKYVIDQDIKKQKMENLTLRDSRPNFVPIVKFVASLTFLFSVR